MGTLSEINPPLFKNPGCSSEAGNSTTYITYKKNASQQKTTYKYCHIT